VTALAHNNTLLILDETNRAGLTARQRAEVVTSVAFGLAEGSEKERLSNPGSARSWRCYFLSTSNWSLAQLGRRGNVAIDEAHLGRLADIPLPSNGHGIYEELHDFADGERLSDALQRRSRKYCGMPGKKFVQKLDGEKRADLQGLQEFLEAERAAYRKALKTKAEAEGLRALNRNSSRNATAFAAGSLASKYGIVPWSRKKILWAILTCELDQLRQPDEDEDSAAPPPETFRAKLVQYLNDNRKNFMNLDKKRPRYARDKLDAAPGYRAKEKGQRWYYITADQLKAIIGTRDGARAVKQMLAKEGLLERKKKKFVVQRRIFVGGKGRDNYAWVHAIKADILKKDKSDNLTD
jgi:hypothetical protein